MRPNGFAFLLSSISIGNRVESTEEYALIRACLGSDFKAFEHQIRCFGDPSTCI
jgi:hypothetical protein